MSETNQNVLFAILLLLGLTSFLGRVADSMHHAETQALIELRCGTPTETSLKWPPPEDVRAKEGM